MKNFSFYIIIVIYLNVCYFCAWDNFDLVQFWTAFCRFDLLVLENFLPGVQLLINYIRYRQKKQMVSKNEATKLKKLKS